MTVRKVIRMGHPVLREKSRPLSEEEILSSETQNFIKDLFDTMEKYEGIGIASPQVGVAWQLAIVGVPVDNPRYPDTPESDTYIVINPKVTILDKKKQGFWEGCLSVPGLRGYVERPRKIKVEFLDEKAQPQSLIVEDFIATVFQHELDHLNGKLYIDRIKDTKMLAYNEEFDEFWTEEDEEDEADE